jgi:hypothetical protein
MDDLTPTQLLAKMDAYLAQQDAYLAAITETLTGSTPRWPRCARGSRR